MSTRANLLLSCFHPILFILFSWLSPYCLGTISISTHWPQNSEFCVWQLFMVCYITIISLSWISQYLQHLSIPLWRYRLVPIPCCSRFLLPRSTNLIASVALNKFQLSSLILAPYLSFSPWVTGGTDLLGRELGKCAVHSYFFLLLLIMILLCSFCKAQKVRYLIYFVLYFPP